MNQLLLASDEALDVFYGIYRAGKATSGVATASNPFHSIRCLSITIGDRSGTGAIASASIQTDMQ